MLGSWPGLLYLCMDDYRAIKSILGTLQVPVPEVQDAILELVFTSLRLKSSPWMNAFLDGKRLTGV